MRSTRNQPFCWQEKQVLRLLRKTFSGLELSKYRNLYLTLTEIESDNNGADVAHYTKKVATYSGLPARWIPTGLAKMEELEIISIETIRKDGKVAGKVLHFSVPSNLPKPTSRKATCRKMTSIEDINSSLEDNKKIEDNIPQPVKQIVDNFQNEKLKTHGNLKAVQSPNIKSWYEAIDKLHRIDKKDYDTIGRVLYFSLHDNFWKDNLISLSSIRKKGSNDLMKFENIEKAMKSRQSGFDSFLER